MKLNSTHLALFVLVVLAVVGYVVLTLAHDQVPDVLATIVTAGSGALFGVTLPAGGGGRADE